MRKEPFTVGSQVHVVKRGSHGMSIVRDEKDRLRFLLSLVHLNDKWTSENWFRDLEDCGLAHTLKRPTLWPPQERIVQILCFCLVENHFHLLLKEIQDGGIAKFMQKIGIAMAKHFNEKYKQRGSLFQSAYRSRTITDDRYLRYVSAYIQVKNTFEIYPGGYEKARREFNKAFEWAAAYPYSSLMDFMGRREDSFVEPEILGEIFSREEYKSFCRDIIEGRNIDDILVKQVSFE